jgi:hypothetical protein
MPEISNTTPDSKPTAEELTGLSSAQLAECERVAALSDEDFKAEVASRVSHHDAIFEALLEEAGLYQASPIKRKRASKVEVELRRADLCDIVKAMKPMTVRQVFYQATVRGIVEKSEAG